MKNLVLFILTFITHISFSQEKLDTIAISNDIDSIQTDSLENIGEIETTINYSATDSIFYDLKTQTLKLYGNSKIDYGNINLSAYEILIDWDEQTIDANFRVDSLGKKIGKPIFTEDNQSYETDKITYNFDSKKAKIKGIVTQLDDAYMQGEDVKKNELDELFIHDAKYTTCNLAEPHFHISAKKNKGYSWKKSFIRSVSSEIW